MSDFVGLSLITVVSALLFTSPAVCVAGERAVRWMDTDFMGAGFQEAASALKDGWRHCLHIFGWARLRTHAV